MDGQMNGCIGVWMEGGRDGWMDGCGWMDVDGWMRGWMNGWTNEWMYRCLDGRMKSIDRYIKNNNNKNDNQ